MRASKSLIFLKSPFHEQKFAQRQATVCNKITQKLIKRQRNAIKNFSRLNRLIKNHII